MKKLLVILMLVTSVIGWNAYARDLQLMNDSTNYLAVECFPSKHSCNGMLTNDVCYCLSGDTDMYFGHVGMPQEQPYLDSITDFTATMNTNGTGYHDLGDGNVWHIQSDPTEVINRCTINGTVGGTIVCMMMAY